MAIATERFEDSQQWADVENALKDFADAYEIDQEVLILAVTEAIDSIINNEE